MTNPIFLGEHMVAPPSKIILRTLRELSYNHMKGILLLIPGSTGNLFNFGLAVERAKNDNLRVKMIQVKDTQVENPVKRIGKKGSTGVLLLSKIAGAMSEEGKTLSDIYIQCNEIAQNIYTIGLSCSSFEKSNLCTVCKRNMCKEPGVKKVSYINQSACIFAVEGAVNILLDDTFNVESGKLNLRQNDCIIILINTNGALQKANSFRLIKELIDFFTANVITIKRIYFCNFACSSDVTISFLKIEQPEILRYLGASCSAPGKSLA